MRFADLLRTTVMLSAAAATMLAVVTVASATRDGDDAVVLICAAWWLGAAVVGVLLGRKDATTPAIGKLLADAKAVTMLPEHRPTSVVLNRLWPLLLCTVVAGGLGVFVAPQVAGIGAGFAIIWALAWRRQDAAVAAIEERDGATFFVERTSPVEPLRLVRTPGFRREVPTMNHTGTTPG